MILLYIPLIFFEMLKYYIGFSNIKTFVINICVYISKINIFYIKIFQWFTYNLTNDRKTNKELYSFFSQYTNLVPYYDKDIDYNSIQKLIYDIKKDGNNFTINFTPINMGTIALAFEALLNEEKVIVKVLRKNIREQLNNFYKQLEYIRNIIQYIQQSYFIQILIKIQIFSFLKNIDNKIISDIIHDCKDEFILQIDLENEANNIELFQKHYKDCKFIKIPNVYKKYTLENPNVIVMEYIKGNKITDNSPEDNLIYIEIIHKFIISSYFIKQIFHADLHLGNIFFIKTDSHHQLGIIDFGLIGTLDSVCEQDFLYELLIAYSNNNTLNLINSILDYLEIINNLTFDDSFKNEIYHITEISHIFEPSATITHYDIFTFIQLLKQYNLKISKRLSFLLLAVVSQSASINKLKENCINLDLNLLIKNITDNLLK